MKTAVAAPPEGRDPGPLRVLLLEDALDAAQEALFDIYLHEGSAYGTDITVRPGSTIREKINRFNLAIQDLNR